jgi:NhaA family Na+:H+ antiporter
MRKRLQGIVIRPVQDFLRRESTSGVLILFAALIGILVANSPIRDRYFDLINLTILNINYHIAGIDFYLHLSFLKMINYILMTIFFFVVGLEIKRELTSGHLASRRTALAPLIAALGGMAVPAIIYISIAGNTALHGWGVPVATDIALAVGVLTLIGSKVAPSLRTFLLGLAVIDDIGAILIIAFVYTKGFKLSWLALAMIAVGIVLIFRKLGLKGTYLYVFMGSILWYGLYRSGIHPTLAGVILGLLTPNIGKDKKEIVDLEDGSLSLIEWLEAKVHPWSVYAIVPLFAFANTGVEISSSTISEVWRSPIAWGIFLGLVIGKPLGIFVAVFTAAKAKVCDFPSGASNSSLIATGSAAGIGFTVAIFIAQLAFDSPLFRDTAVLSVIIASVVSGFFSWIVFAAVKK